MDTKLSATASNEKTWGTMNIGDKIVHVVKIIIFFVSFGLLFPHVMGH